MLDAAGDHVDENVANDASGDAVGETDSVVLGETLCVRCEVPEIEVDREAETLPEDDRVADIVDDANALDDGLRVALVLLDTDRVRVEHTETEGLLVPERD